MQIVILLILFVKLVFLTFIIFLLNALMDKLINDKKRIEHEILHSTNMHLKNKAELKNIEHKINTIKLCIEQDKEDLLSIDTKLDNYKKLTFELQHLVKAYKNKYSDKLRTKYYESYKTELQNVQLLSFDDIEYISETFLKVKNILKRIEKFPIFYNKLNSYFIMSKDDIIRKLIRNIDDNFLEIKNIHKVSYFVVILSDIEAVFNENIFVDYCFKGVYDSFAYNFLSDKKTNRMDKPEWFLKFILEKIKCEKRKLNLYHNLNPEKNVFAIFCDKIKYIINIKVNEIVESSSLQKRNLLLHFAEEIIKMNNELFTMFSIKIKLNDLSNYIIKYEKLSIDRRMDEVNQGNYRNWFNEYKLMINESYVLFSSLSQFNDLIFRIICQYIIDHVYLYCDVFIKQIRLNSKDELRLVCFLFSELESFRHCAIEKMDDYFVNNETDSCLNIDISNISQLNNENFKLIKNMAVNEIQTSLKRIKEFTYVSDKQITHCAMEIYDMLDDFRKYIINTTSYKILENHLGEACDDFIFNSIILRLRFDHTEYDRLKEFIGKLREMMGSYKQWKVQVGCDCIKDILNGNVKNENKSSIYNIIYEKYECEKECSE